MSGKAGSGDDFQQLLATIRAARDDKTRMEILKANVARAGRNVGNYRAIIDLFGDAGDRASVATILVAAHRAEGAEAASLRASLLSLNITPAAGGGGGGGSSVSSSSSTSTRRRREESGAGGDNASQALATVGSGSQSGMVQSPGGGALGSPMDLSSGSEGEGEGEGSGHGARSLGGSTLNSQEVELEAEDADALLSLEAAPSPLFGPAGAKSVGAGADQATVSSAGGGSITTAATAAVPGIGFAVPAHPSPSVSAPARGSMPPPLTIPSAAAAAAAASSSSSAHVGSSAPIGISGSTGVGGGVAEELNSLVVVGSVATTISSYDSVGSLSTIESSASAEVTSHRGAGRQPFTARSSLLKPVAEPNNG